MWTLSRDLVILSKWYEPRRRTGRHAAQHIAVPFVSRDPVGVIVKKVVMVDRFGVDPDFETTS